MTKLSRIRFSPTVWRLFDLYLGVITAFRFHRVVISGALDMPEPKCPVILISNHSTWWDGFFLRLLQKRRFAAWPLYTVTLASEQHKLPFFFKRLGILPMGSGPRHTLGLMRSLLARANEARGEIVVSYFPQGKIYPSSKRPLDFRRGVEVLARYLGAVVIPVGIHIEPMQNKKPTAFIVVGPTLSDTSIGELERAVERELDTLLGQLNARGEALTSSPAESR